MGQCWGSVRGETGTVAQDTPAKLQFGNEQLLARRHQCHYFTTQSVGSGLIFDVVLSRSSSRRLMSLTCLGIQSFKRVHHIGGT